MPASSIRRPCDLWHEQVYSACRCPLRVCPLRSDHAALLALLVSQMPPAKHSIGRKAKGKQQERSHPNSGSSKAGSSKRARESPGAAAAKPSPSMPPPPPRKKAAPELDDDWTMPSLSDDSTKARRKLEKMLREVETLEAQNGTEHQP